MSSRAKRLEQTYLQAMSNLLKTTTHKKSQIGAKALSIYTRALIEECPSMNGRTSDELMQIVHELDGLS